MNKRFRFIVLHGMLGWGVTSFLLFSAIRYFRHEGHINAATFLVDLPIWIFGGFFFGSYLWAKRKVPD